MVSGKRRPRTVKIILVVSMLDLLLQEVLGIRYYDFKCVGVLISMKNNLVVGLKEALKMSMHWHCMPKTLRWRILQWI